MASSGTYVLITFCLIHFSYGHYQIYSEIQNLGGSCYPRDTCSTSRPNDQDNLWGNYTCECGRHCLRHRTCCVDSVHLKDVEATSYTDVGSCQRVETMSASVWMVSKCSNQWREDPSVRMKCESELTDLRDPMAAVPATSMISGTTYRNHFCAVCNFDLDHLVLWNIEVIFKRPLLSAANRNKLLKNLEYNPSRNSWGFQEGGRIKNRGEFRKVALRFSIPSVLSTVVKHCHPRIISQCKSSRANPDLQRKCFLYYAPINIGGDRRYYTYRNIHCALCNDLSAPFDAECPPVALQPSNQRRVSFAILLDVNQKNGAKVGQVQVCDNDQLYDPFFKKCRSVRCALTGYVVRNGSCVKA